MLWNKQELTKIFREITKYIVKKSKFTKLSLLNKIWQIYHLFLQIVVVPENPHLKKFAWNYLLNISWNLLPKSQMQFRNICFPILHNLPAVKTAQFFRPLKTKVPSQCPTPLVETIQEYCTTLQVIFVCTKKSYVSL